MNEKDKQIMRDKIESIVIDAIDEFQLKEGDCIFCTDGVTERIADKVYEALAEPDTRDGFENEETVIAWRLFKKALKSFPFDKRNLKECEYPDIIKYRYFKPLQQKQYLSTGRGIDELICNINFDQLAERYKAEFGGSNDNS